LGQSRSLACLFCLRDEMLVSNPNAVHCGHQLVAFRTKNQSKSAKRASRIPGSITVE
jgi:hypothetical protein